MRLNARDLTIFDGARLREEFGAFVGPSPGAFSWQAERELHGPWYRQTLDQLSLIVAHQWRRGIRRSALRGFFLHGPPGLGKTTLVKRASYELCRLFEPEGPDGDAAPVQLVLIDGADLARSRYGETEELLDALFDFVQPPGDARRSVLLFDDVESLFFQRGNSGVREWHFSQNSVFFHRVDELDTSRAVVMLTTNRADLVDAAVRDRFEEIAVPAPPRDVLLEVLRAKLRQQELPEDDAERYLEQLEARGGDGFSVRAIERLVMRQYIQSLTATLPHDQRLEAP
ncbi:MAG TPA: AAA family ATPase [Chloroflexota bacterium]|jgi:SpoVK/Ycf46/Vps4 family AAA+-type ATPase